MRLNFWKKSKPLLTPKEIEIQAITAQLRRWDVSERKEILDGVIKRAFPVRFHLHLNPQRKQEAA